MNVDEIEEDVTDFLKAVDWSKMKIIELPPSQPDFKIEYAFEGVTERESVYFNKKTENIDEIEENT